MKPDPKPLVDQAPLTRVPGLVSVIIPTYNYGQYLLQSVNSVLLQDYAHAEVIVVDDGSNDAPAWHLRTLLPHPRLRLIHQAHAGISAARNSGIAAAAGEYVSFLDADDFWPSQQQLSIQVNYLKEYKQAGLVFGDAAPFDGTNLSEGYLKTFGFYSAQARETPDFMQISVKLLWTKGFFIPTGAALIRHDCLREIGTFDPSLRMFEDLDFWLRLCGAYRVVFVPRIFLARREHGNNTGETRSLFLDDAVRVFEKNQLQKRGISIRRTVRGLHYEAGRYHFRQGNFRVAQTHFAQSLTSGLNARALLYLMLCFKGRAWN